MMWQTQLRGLGVLLFAMTVLAVLETAMPFVRSPHRRRHVSPNLVLTAVTLGSNLLLNAGTVLVAARFVAADHALAERALSPGAVLLAGIVVLDGSTYLCHRAMHAVPALWRVHCVHHSDPLVDVTTTLRHHPIEIVLRFVFTAVPAALLGLPPLTLAVYRVLSAFIGLLEHVNVLLWQPLDSLLSVVFGTPNMHKVHHSRSLSETNTNYGNVLSVFDRALGTFTPSDRARGVRYGLAGYDGEEPQKLWSLLRLRPGEPVGSEAPPQGELSSVHRPGYSAPQSR